MIERSIFIIQRLAAALMIALIVLAESGCVIITYYGERGTAIGQSAPPPKINHDTIVLFDGKSWTGWHQRDGRPSQWLVRSDGSVQVHDGDAITDQEFGDFQLHIEFLCPPTTGKTGQAKSNSGVYLHGRYEVQVLDSFGDAPEDSLCGGIYQIAAPLVNASRPSGQWQSYDIIFRAPRFDADKKMTQPPRISVIHNGAAIHNNLILPHPTPGGLDQSMPATGQILLQDHGDPVCYRNIWLRKLVETP